MNIKGLRELSDTLLGFSARPARVEDARAIHAVFVAADGSDGTSAAGSWEEYADELSLTDFNPATDSQVVLAPGGKIIAAGWFRQNQNIHEEHYASFYAAVHPDFREKGVGTWLMSWLEAAAAQKLTAYPDDLPRWFSVTGREGLKSNEDLFRCFGYRPVRSYYKMRCELLGLVRDASLPGRLKLVSYQTSLDSQVHTLMDTAFKDHWMYQQHTSELWAMHTSRSLAFRPQASFLVFDGEKLIAATICSIWAEDSARLGIKEGWVDMIGVLPEYRKRGLASSLLQQAMHEFQELGMDYTGLFVDAENETGALGLYERLGFRKVGTTIRWAKYLV